MPPLPAVLPPIAFAGTHWSNGAWTNTGQVGDADGTRMKMWKDDLAGTTAAVNALVSLGLPVFFGGDLNTPAAHLPKFNPDQVFAYNSAGLDKLIYVPAGPYEIRVGAVQTVSLNSDHDLHVMPVTLLLNDVEVVTFRFGAANIRRNMATALKVADMQTILPLCDVVVWQETDTDAANALIDQTFPLAEWMHLFPNLEVDMSIRKSLFKLTPKHEWPAGLVHGVDSVKISDGVAHVSPNRYLGQAVVTPIPQTTN